MINRLVLCAALLWIPMVAPVVAQDADGLICVTVAQAQTFEARSISVYHQSVLQLKADEIKLFAAFLGGGFDNAVDIVTLFVFADGHSEFAMGSTDDNIKCVGDHWVFSPERTKDMLRAVYGDAI